MAINKSYSDYLDKLGNSTLNKIGTASAGIVGVGAIAYGVINFVEGMSWHSFQTVAMAAGGAALAYGAFDKVRYGEDIAHKQDRRKMYAIGSAIIGSALVVPQIVDSFKSEDTVVVSTPPGTCEINIPYLSEDTPSVLKMQAALNEGGFGIIYVDGINGQQTKTALSNFKVANGFDPAVDFNQEMCALMPSLVDGNPDTPVTMAGN